MKHLFTLLSLLLFTGCLSADSTVVAKEGQALMPVVITPDASDELRLAANDLAATLGTMTGGEFAVQTSEDASAGIVLGSRLQFPGLGYDEALEVRDRFDGMEAYVISTRGERILLLGATEKGAIHAAYRLLAEAGCRWFFPNDAWTVIPRMPSLTLNLEIASRPALLERRIWYNYGFFDRAEGRVAREYNQWRRRNRQGASLTVYTGHAWQAIAAAKKAAFEAHPDYYALVDGERKGPQFCVSNEGLRKLVAEYVVDYFEKRPEADMVSVDPADGAGHCECQPCAEMGSISDRVFGLANHAARALAEVYPGKLVGLLAYNQHSEPPAFQLEPNVYIQLTRGFTRGQYTFEELREIWPTVCRSMGYYDYYSVYLWDWDMIPGGRAANTDYVAESIRSYVAGNATTLSCESANNWGLHGRGYYLASQLMWNPEIDDQAVLRDFYEKAFGPAAAVMQRYYERLDPGTKPLLSEHLIALALRDVQEATELAAEHPAVLARLEQLKQYLHYVCLRWRFNAAKDKDVKKALALEILTHVYRNRYTYMNHWEAMRQTQTRRWAKEFEEPAWAFNDPTPDKPWAVDDPNTPAETAAQFAADLERFQPEDIVEVEFSDELVPAGQGASAPLRVGFQRSGEFILHSHGQPLEWTLTVGTIAWYRDRADARYRLVREQDDFEVVAGRLKLTGEPVLLKADVPTPGRYRLEVEESGAGFRLELPADYPAVMPLERGRHYYHFGVMAPMYFHVPEGTEVLHYYVQNSLTHILLGPDGQEIFKGEGSGIFFHVPVPEGLDGKTWCIRQMALGELWFFNAPNVLAASPGTLMLPKELVE